MYSGTTLSKYSGRLLGAHQKIDRVARRHLGRIMPPETAFPAARLILHFEGKNGPDGIKRKSPARDEPWHYFDPFDPNDGELLDLIEDHYKHLVRELKKGNQERAAFEAAWLAHAIVDGLTPAHHYPYEEKLTELRGGAGKETRTTIRHKLVMPGKTRPQQLKNNWLMWGPKGLLTTHGLFEIGIATILLPLTFSEARPTDKEVDLIKEIGIKEWFVRAAREIAMLGMYERYYEKGWTPKLAWEVRHKLGPTIVKSVTLVWYAALSEAAARKKS